MFSSIKLTSKIIFVFIIICVLIFFSIFYNYKDLFISNYPYNPKIQTPQKNYLEISNKIKNQSKYKNDLSVSLSPTPTIKCDKLYTKTDCNENGCNWFGSYCSAMYPSYL